jgi:hypothetical protein
VYACRCCFVQTWISEVGDKQLPCLKAHLMGCESGPTTHGRMKPVSAWQLCVTEAFHPAVSDPPHHWL